MELICLTCGFTRVAYVLRHAEIRVQGYTDVLNRRHKWDIDVSDVNDRRQRTVDGKGHIGRQMSRCKTYR